MPSAAPQRPQHSPSMCQTRPQLWDRTSHLKPPAASAHLTDYKVSLCSSTESPPGTVEPSSSLMYHLQGPICVPALLPTMAHQAQGCCEQQQTLLCLESNSQSHHNPAVPVSGALHHPLGPTAPLQCKYTERLSKVQRFEAREWLFSVQNQGMAFQLEQMPIQHGQTTEDTLGSRRLC